MSEISSVLSNLMSQGNNYKFTGGDNSTINPSIEWTKWLSYISQEEQERKELLYKLETQELSEEQSQELLRYQKQQELSSLFQKYNRDECTQKEYLEVYDYMVKNSIMDLMIQKLTKQELIEAYRIVENCNLLPQEELYNMVNYYRTEENYVRLSHFDAFVLHIISDKCSSKVLDIMDSEDNSKRQLVK